MGGGNSHQRTINRSAKARIIDEVVGTVLKQMDRSAPPPPEKPALDVFRRLFATWRMVNGRNGVLLVTHGKTAAARRVLPMTPRVRDILERRWEAAAKPAEGWVWGAPTRSGHVESSSLKKQHANAFRVLAEEAVKKNGKPIRPFVLYSLPSKRRRAL
jgi:hypothetical protein